MRSIYKFFLLVLFLFQCTYASACNIIDSINENQSFHGDVPSKKGSPKDIEFTEDGEEEENESHKLFPFDVRETLFFVYENKASFKDLMHHVLHSENISKRAVPIFVWVQNFRI